MVRTFTSASAHKALKRLDSEKSMLLFDETDRCTYKCMDNEDPLVPDYDYDKTKKRIAKIDEDVRKIKHGINLLNTTKKLENFDMTLDEALIYMAQLTYQKNRLSAMRRGQNKERVSPSYRGSDAYVEYKYLNYDLDRIRQDYDDVEYTISQLQLDIDYINQTEQFSVNLNE